MEIIVTIATAILGGIILNAIINVGVRGSGISLNEKFVSLGVLQGKTLDEIISVVGYPSAISALGNGKVLRQWQATGYHIALIFNENDICEGISSEISA